MLRNKVVRVLRKAKADFFSTIIENAHGNSNYMETDEKLTSKIISKQSQLN